MRLANRSAKRINFKLTCLVFMLPLTLLTAPLSQAQIYSCKDAGGRTISSDRPMPECDHSDVQLLSKSGIVKGDIPAPLNAEQKRQKQIQDAKRQAAADAIEQQRQQDRALLARYHNEDDIAISRRYYLALSQDYITRDKGLIEDAKKQLESDRLESEFYKKKKVLPAALRNSIDEANRAIANAKSSIADHQADAVKINLKFDDMLKRYRELTQGQGGMETVAASR
ncbi:DUF4124 domain-containing protein [Glaciimonas sp. GS1]|uniref:DUF4124 domain-containing protein n=2 Tax=Glaciimonas soli TaxID=2590999 RepID=A0A843YSP3_9BURK|nr:DUF4124 domain-containing protein [Glaciimonas soli]